MNRIHIRAEIGNRRRSRWISLAVAATMAAGIVIASLLGGGPGASAAGTALLRQSSVPHQTCPAGTACTQQPQTTPLLIPHRGGAGFRPVPRPHVVEMDRSHRVPQGKLRPPVNIGPATHYGGPAPIESATSGLRDQSLSHKSVTVKSLLKTDLGIATLSGSPGEPTAAEGQGVVWYTGNSEDALSTDSGKHFTYFNPSRMFPDNGLPFCCDQLVSYSPQAKIFVWVMQYWCGPGTTSPATAYCPTAGTTSNRLRIAVATPAGLRANAKHPGYAWTYWSVTPQTSFGAKIGATKNTWFDQSKMGVNSVYVNWSFDVLNASVSSIYGRINLDLLAAHSRLRWQFYFDTHAAINVAQGLNTANSYFVGNNSDGDVAIRSWPNGGSVTLHVIKHSTIPTYNPAINGTDGMNWYSRWGTFPGEVGGATLKGNTLWVAQGTGRSYCKANCSSGTPTLKLMFPEPAVFVSEYNVLTWKKVAERWLYNAKIALTWPALQTDGAGDVGIVYRESTQGQNPQPAAQFLIPNSNRFYSVEPEGSPQLSGDYYSLRPGPTSNTFVMTAYATVPLGYTHWQYIEWGK